MVIPLLRKSYDSQPRLTLSRYPRYVDIEPRLFYLAGGLCDCRHYGFFGLDDVVDLKIVLIGILGYNERHGRQH